MLRFGILALTVLAIWPAVAVAEQSLTDTEIRELLSGKSKTTVQGITRYYADGRFTYTWHNGRTTSGRWEIVKDGVCQKFEGAERRCDKYMKDAEGPYTLNTGGMWRFAVGPLDSPAPPPGASGAVTVSNTVTLCEQSIGYSLTAADAASKHASAFVGVWSGHFIPGGLCAALIVEKVRTDGTASIIYATGSHARFGFVPRQRRLSATITDKLRFKMESGSFVFEVVNPMELSGSYGSGYDIAHGSFTRR